MIPSRPQDAIFKASFGQPDIARAIDALPRLVQLAPWAARSFPRLRDAAPFMRDLAATLGPDERARSLMTQLHVSAPLLGERRREHTPPVPVRGGRRSRESPPVPVRGGRRSRESPPVPLLGEYHHEDALPGPRRAERSLGDSLPGPRRAARSLGDSLPGPLLAERRRGDPPPGPRLAERRFEDALPGPRRAERRLENLRPGPRFAARPSHRSCATPRECPPRSEGQCREGAAPVHEPGRRAALRVDRHLALEAPCAASYGGLVSAEIVMGNVAEAQAAACRMLSVAVEVGDLDDIETARRFVTRRIEREKARWAGWTGLEPAASGVTGRRYNQLNYHPSGSRSSRSGGRTLRRPRDRSRGKHTASRRPPPRARR